jgi:hypothetical protein
MPVPAEPLSVLLPTASIVLAGLVFAAAGLGRRLWCSARRARAARAYPYEMTLPCRYCHWGMSELADETVRFEGQDLVDVRCFVCRSCGLPEWSISRTPLVKCAG